MHNSDAQKTPLVDVVPFVRLGWVVLLAGLGSFLLWAAPAPLDKGVVSTGTVVVDGYRKAVQAPTGGVVTSIAVKEGRRYIKATCWCCSASNRRSPNSPLRASII